LGLTLGTVFPRSWAWRGTAPRKQNSPQRNPRPAERVQESIRVVNAEKEEGGVRIIIYTRLKCNVERGKGEKRRRESLRTDPVDRANGKENPHLEPGDDTVGVKIELRVW
jgi:hypothetical protein